MSSGPPISSQSTAQPLTETERGIAALWQEALEISEPLDPDDNFFGLGGDSVAMVMVELRIKEEFAIEFPPGTMLTTSSLRDLSALVEERARLHRSSGNAVEPTPR
jgi:acyl carrier protein